MPPKLILASGSPRRQELLSHLQVPFTVQVSQFDETSISTSGLTPDIWVQRLAQGKAQEVRQQITEPAIILAADTTVILDGNYLNKPTDTADAFRMLRSLSGQTHSVYTGVCLLTTDGVETTYAVQSRVTFKYLTDDEIHTYIATGDPMDKAGSYGIQGAAREFIEKIDGDYYNIMGLPLAAVRESLLRYFPGLVEAPAEP